MLLEGTQPCTRPKYTKWDKSAWQNTWLIMALIYKIQMQIQNNQLLWCAWIQGCEEGKVGRSPSNQIGSSSWLVRSCVLQFSVLVMDICSGGGTYWRLLLRIISLQLSWFPQAMLKALEETSHPSLHSCCVSSCVPLIAHSDLFPSHTEVCGSTLPFQTPAVFATALCNSPQHSHLCSASSDPHDSSLQLHLFTMCQGGGKFLCQQHLRQQEFLTALGSLLCWGQG